MKNLALLLLFLTTFMLRAQETLKPTPKDTLPFIMVGGAMGINNLSGMAGVVVGLKANDEFSFRIGFGFGGWGRKFSAGFKYELKTTNSWGFGMSYSTYSGDKNFKANLETSDSGRTVLKPVIVELQRASTINLTTSYKWIFNKHHQVYFDIGYAIPIETDPYRVKSDVTLTENGKTMLHRRQPGGLILGLGILFGVR